MQVELITLKEYCDLSGYSYKSNYVQKMLRKDTLLVGMVGFKKFAGSYMIQVLKTWKDLKEEGL